MISVKSNYHQIFPRGKFLLIFENLNASQRWSINKADRKREIILFICTVTLNAKLNLNKIKEFSSSVRGCLVRLRDNLVIGSFIHFLFGMDVLSLNNGYSRLKANRCEWKEMERDGTKNFFSFLHL